MGPNLVAHLTPSMCSGAFENNVYGYKKLFQALATWVCCCCEGLPRFSGAVLWNGLLLGFRQSSSLDLFKSGLNVIFFRASCLTIYNGQLYFFFYTRPPCKTGSFYFFLRNNNLYFLMSKGG